MKTNKTTENNSSQTAPCNIDGVRLRIPFKNMNIFRLRSSQKAFDIYLLDLTEHVKGLRFIVVELYWFQFGISFYTYEA